MGIRHTKQQLEELLAEAQTPGLSEQRIRELWNETTSIRIRRALVVNPSTPLAFLAEAKTYASMIEVIAESPQMDLVLLFGKSSGINSGFTPEQIKCIEFFKSATNLEEFLDEYCYTDDELYYDIYPKHFITFVSLVLLRAQGTPQQKLEALVLFFGGSRITQLSFPSGYCLKRAKKYCDKTARIQSAVVEFLPVWEKSSIGRSLARKFFPLAYTRYKQLSKSKNENKKNQSRVKRAGA